MSTGSRSCIRESSPVLCKGKIWDRNPILEVPDLEDQVHVEETEEDEKEDEQACHLVGVLVFDWRHLSIRSWSEE